MTLWVVRPTLLLVRSPVSASALRLAPAGICQSRRSIVSDCKRSLLPSKPAVNRSFSLLCQTRPYSTRPRLLPSSTRHPSRPNLKSSIGVLCSSAAVALLIVAWVTVDTCTSAAPRPTPEEAMPPTTAAPGHVGNLTAEQEEKLRKLWLEISKLCGMGDPEAAGDAASASSALAKTDVAPEDPESPQKKRFSLFRRKNTESSQTSNGSASEAKNGADSNDKHGQTKQFYKTLESQSPESIRETIWSMVKQDNPDALMLRFLRARKWDVQQALIMLVSTMNWRHTQMLVDSDIMKNGEAGAVKDEKDGSAEAKKLASDFMAQSRQGKSFLHGSDREGRPICVVRARLHKPSAQSAESLERYTVFIIETARLTLEAPVDTAVSMP